MEASEHHPPCIPGAHQLGCTVHVGFTKRHAGQDGHGNALTFGPDGEGRVPQALGRELPSQRRH